MALTYIYNPFTGNLDAIDSATGSPNTVAGFDNAGNIQSIPLWNVNTATGGLYQNLSIGDTVNPGSPTTSVINNFQTTVNPGATVPNLGYLNLQNHGWIAGDDILGYMGFSNTIDSGGTGDRGEVVGLRTAMTLGTSVEASSIGSLHGIINHLRLMDLQTITGSLEHFANTFNLEAGSISNNVTGIRNFGQVDATAQTNDIALLDMGLTYDGTLLGGNVRIGQAIIDVSSALPVGSGMTGFFLGYNLSDASDFVSGHSVGHNLQSGANVSGAIQAFNENTILASGSTANNVISFSSSTQVQAGATLVAGYEGFKVAPILSGTLDGVNSFSSNAQVSTTMDYFSAFQEQSTLDSSAVITNTFVPFAGYSVIQSGATVPSVDMFVASPNINAGAIVTNLLMFRANPTINSNLATATFLDINAYGSGVVTTLKGIAVDLSQVDSPNQKLGLTISDGKVETTSNYLTDVLPASPGFLNLNSIGGMFHVKPGNPTSNTLVLGSAVGTSGIFEDDMGPDAFGGFLGFGAFTSLSQLSVALTKTLDTYNGAAFGASVPDLSGQGITGGGTVTNANILTVVGILNGGDTVAITNLKGLNIPSFFNSFSATNAWGVHVADATVDNYFAKNVVIGGSTGQPVGSEALSVDGSMALLGSTSGEVTISAAPTTTSHSLVMPSAQGGASTVLTNDGSGNLSWAAGGGGGPVYTSFNFANNQASPANVTGFSVNSATNNGFVADMSILREMSDVPPVGDLDEAFEGELGTGPNGSVLAVAVDPSDNSILLGLNAFASFNGNGVPGLVKLSSAGVEDATFTTNLGTGFNDATRAVAIDSTGRCFIGGSSDTFNGNTRRKLVCLSSAGVEDATFTTNLGTKFPSGPTQAINGLAIQSDDDIVAVGNFSTFNGGSPARIVRLNSDGTEDAAFSANLGTGLNAEANVVFIQADGKILVGGTFTALNGSAVAARLIRLNSDGTLDATFDTNLGTGFNSTILSVFEQADGKILVGGSFTSFNGNTRNFMTRLNSDGTEDGAFYTNMGTAFAGVTVRRVIEQAGDNKILVAGNFTDFDGNGLPNIARLNSDGTEDTAFTTLAGTGPSAQTICVAAQTSGALVIGGQFTTYDGAAATRVMLFNVVEEYDQTFTFYGTYSNKNAAWKISDPIGAFDDAGVELSITAGGQLQYISSNLLGTSVTQNMRFMIRGL